MLKKFVAVLSAISIFSAIIPAMAWAEETTAKEIIRYECDEVTNKDTNNKRWIYNKIDAQYPLSVGTDGYIPNDAVKISNVNNITYPEKTYVESWYAPLNWYQNIMTITPDDNLKKAFEGGVATDIWFNPIYENDQYRRFVLMEARVTQGDPLFRVMYDANGDGAGNGRIIVARKVNNGSKDSYNEYHYGKELAYNTWHNVSVSLDESSGLNEPMVVVDGVKLTVIDPEKNIPTKDDGYTMVGYDKLSQVRIGAGTEINNPNFHYNSHILFSDISIYDGPRSEADILEDYEKNVGYYEPEYDIKVVDGFGDVISKSGLDDVFAGNGLMPKITIDTSKVENTDTALFNEQNVTLTDITDNRQLNTTGILNGVIYTVTSDDFVPAHRYLLTIDEAVNENRSKDQTVEFATTKSVPEIVAQYNMNKTVNENNTPCIEDVISGKKTVFEGTYASMNKYDDAYYIGANWAVTEGISDKLKMALNDEFTIDIWFKNNPNSTSGEERIWSVARPKTTNDSGNIHMMLNRKGNLLGFRVNYKYTENETQKEQRVQYLTTNSTSYYTSGWNHLVFSYDTKTEEKSAVLNGNELNFDKTTYVADAWGRDPSLVATLPEGAKPYTMPENGIMFVNGTTPTIDYTYGGWASKYFIGKQTYYNKAANKIYMNYLAGLDNDKYDTAYDITLSQGGRELAKTDLTVLTKDKLTAQIAIAKTDGFDSNAYIENSQGEKIIPEISWNTEGTLATLSFDGLAAGEYRFIIAKEASDSTGAAIRKTDYILPLKIVGTTELSLLVNGVAVPQGTKVIGDAYALAELVNVDNAVLIAAKYKDGNLVDILSSDEKFGEFNNQLGIFIEGIAEGETIKLMLWDSLYGMMPIITNTEY